MMEHRSLRRIAEPAIEPVSVTEMNEHLRLDGSFSQTDMQMWIKAAREWLERYAGVAFINQTWAATWDRFPGAWPWRSQRAVLRLPIRPVQSLVSITYFDSAGIEQVTDAGVYRLVAASGEVQLASGAQWPTILDGSHEAVTVTWIAGYGDAPGDVPEMTRQAIRMLAASFHEHRMAAIDPQIENWLLGMIADRRIAIA